MFRQLEDFLKAHEQLAEGTSKVFATLSDDNLGLRVADGHRTLGQIAWHIVATVPEMMNRTGLGLASVDHEAMPPRAAADIVAAYRKVSKELASALRQRWSDEALQQSDEMYGQQWPRGLTLAALLNHEVHHRGQMTVLLRQAGATVPGIYGPAKEEWSQLGIPEPPY
jgi:uncharacterized damage-inducible protein DinB